MQTLRRSLLTAMAAAALPGAALAQSAFPSRPIRLIVPFAAGGGTDIVARLVATAMSTSLGQQILVDNKAGAGGSLGSDAVAKAAPDGYTLLMATVSTHAINPALQVKATYDPIRSFTPVSLVARVGGVVVVSAKSRITTLGELVQAMKAAPGRITFGSQGVGGIGHLMGQMLNTQTDTQSVHVPYKGAAPALQDLIAGNIDVLYDTVPAVLPHLKAGTLRALAVTTPNRSPVLPYVPTTAEAGFPAFQAITWNALLAPAGTPGPVVNVLNAAAVRAVQSEEIRARMTDLSTDPVGSSPAALAEFMESEVRRWAPVVKASGARLE